MVKGQVIDADKTCVCKKGWKIRAHVFLCVMGLLFHNYLLHLIDDNDLTIQKLANNLEKIRVGLVYNGKEGENAEFVIKR